jgi:hypothetical protein
MEWEWPESYLDESRLGRYGKSLQCYCRWSEQLRPTEPMDLLGFGISVRVQFGPDADADITFTTAGADFIT